MNRIAFVQYPQDKKDGLGGVDVRPLPRLRVELLQRVIVSICERAVGEVDDLIGKIIHRVREEGVHFQLASRRVFHFRNVSRLVLLRQMR